MGIFELDHTKRWTFVFTNFLRDAVWVLRNALVELVSRLLCSAVKSVKISAARCPEIRNPIVVHLSEK